MFVRPLTFIVLVVLVLVVATSIARTQPATTVPPPATSTVPPPPPPWSQVTMTGVFSLFAGAAAGATVNFLAGIVTQRRAAKQRAITLRASLRAELTQLIDVMRNEITFADTAPWTWLPVRDYFDAYRKSQDIAYKLEQDEVGVVTEAMHVVEERMGYLYRKSQDLSADMGTPFGRNVKL